MKSKLFVDIAELVTLCGARRQEGRRVREKDLEIIKNAALAVRGGTIVWAGSKSKIPKDLQKLNSTEISLDKQIVIPGFVDCHTHMVFACDRSLEFEMRNQGRSYQDIAKAGGGIQSTVNATRNASAHALYQTGLQRLQDHVRQGVTS